MCKECKDIFGNLIGWAEYSNNLHYRYTLGRIINHPVNKSIIWIMLNPSTATEKKLDPTLTRCYNFSKQWGFDEMVILNLFAYRSTDPTGILTQKDPVGVLNDDVIRSYLSSSNAIILGWGSFKLAKERKKQVMNLLEKVKCTIYCLGLTKDGQPKHPLYLKKNQKKYSVLYKKEMGWVVKDFGLLKV